MSRQEMCRPIEDFLKSLPRETVYFIPNPGNAGDSLITMSTLQMLGRVGLPYRIVLSPDEDLKGKIVLYGGGGNFVPYYEYASWYISRLHRDAKRLILLPHTISGHEGLLRELGTNVDLICREEVSRDYVRSITTKPNVHLMHDMGFYLDVDAFLKDRSRLVATGTNGQVLAGQGLRKVARFYAKSRLRQYKYMLQQVGKGREGGRVLNAFRGPGEQERADIPVPTDNIDISAAFASIWSAFDVEAARRSARSLLRFVSKFDVVNTDRLHGCISGVLMEKTVNLYANNYYKVKAVYEFSMRDRFPNVHWMGQPQS